MAKPGNGHAAIARSAAFLPLALIFANLAALGISVAVPLLVSADQYSIFALSWSVGQLTASLAFEWMRIGVLRYAIGADAGLAARRDATLWQGYVVVTATLLLGALLAGATAPFLSHAGTIAIVAFYAACQGAFEGRQALARANLHNGYYSAAWVLRTFISLLLAVLAAWITGNGAMALLGLAASYPATLLIMNGLRRLPKVSRSLDREQITFLARYGFFAALASIATLFLASILRTVAIALLGLEQAGGVLLAIDLSQKAIMVVGLAVNIVMMQQSFRVAEFGDKEHLGPQMARHIAVSTALIVPSALGFFLIQGPFVSLFVPTEYQATYWQTIGWGCLAGGLLAFRQFAIDSLFAAIERTSSAVVGPVVTVVVFVAAMIVVATVRSATPQILTATFALSVAVGTGVSLALLHAERPFVWPLKDMAIVGISGLAMLVPYRPFPESGSVMQLVIAIGVCAGAYVLIAFAFDLVGVRSTVKFSALFAKAGANANSSKMDDGGPMETEETAFPQGSHVTTAKTHRDI